MHSEHPEVQTHGADDLRLLLQTELIRRCKVNSRYSVRAFAQFLSMEPSALSKILRGRRAITHASFDKVASALNFSPVQISRLAKSVREPRGKNKPLKISRAVTYSFQQISQDSFQLIAEWFHYAILELTTIQSFRPEPAWIAKKLGVTLPEVTGAVERLQKLGLLEIDPHGKWIDTSAHSIASNIAGKFTTSARKQMQKEILAQAIGAIDEVPFYERDNSSMTMAIDTDLIPEANQLIKDFRLNLCSLLQRGKKKDAVYQLSVALFPATNKYIKEKNNEKK